ncbi:putative amidase [Hordeum vulgare]|nr:putative amidase [Hordeum vulgare]
MCRTMSDAVHVLDTIVSYDEHDAAATEATGKYIPCGGYMRFLKKDGLRGKRIRIPNGFFQGYEQAQLNVYKQHLATLSKNRG